MIKNYFIIAWRNILRNRTNTFINIGGLAIGISCFILILIYVKDELRYDRFLSNTDRIYQVNLNMAYGDGQEGNIGKTPASVSSALLRNFPEIESSSRVYRPGDLVVKAGSGNQPEFFTEPGVLAVDSSFLEIFSFKLLSGDRATCLQQPNSIVITQKMAEKYFGTEDAIGKTLLLGKVKEPMNVTGILENVPTQSTLEFDMLASMASFPVVKRMTWSWVWLQVCTYIKLKPIVPNDAYAIKKLETKLPAMIKTEGAAAFERVGQPLDELIKKGGKWNLYFQPFTNIHLYSAGISQIMNNVSDIKYIYIFSIIAVFIIIIACVNFMNLSTAQSFHRAKEVGVRKVLGSEKRQLVKQFLTESFVFSFVACLIALIVSAILLQPFNSLAGKQLDMGSIFSWDNICVLAALMIITSLFAGSYPAFYLASFKPVLILKGNRQRTSFGNLLIRNGLVVFQFAVSTILIISSLVVFCQLRFMQTTDLGINEENIMIIENSERLGNKENIFKNKLSTNRGVSKVSIASGWPSRENFGDSYIPEASTVGDQLPEDMQLSSFIIDENFIPSLDIKIVEGRNFSKEFSDSTSVILNEEAAKQIGWKKTLGSYMTYPGNNNQKFKVVGIAKNFNVSSLHNPVQPFALFYSASKTYELGTSYILIKTKPGNQIAIADELKELWKTFEPSGPLDIAFLDAELNALYRTEQRLGNVFLTFTVLSVFVSCLGLFGLALYTVQRRTKEIGIRKTLGASQRRLFALLSGDLGRLVIIGTIIAFPIAWWGMNTWLQDFAYRISIEWWIFAVAALALLSIALITVSFQTFRAAVANPVKSLRTE